MEQDGGRFAGHMSKQGCRHLIHPEGLLLLLTQHSVSRDPRVCPWGCPISLSHMERFMVFELKVGTGRAQMWFFPAIIMFVLGCKPKCINLPEDINCPLIACPSILGVEGREVVLGGLCLAFNRFA